MTSTYSAVNSSAALCGSTRSRRSIIRSRDAREKASRSRSSASSGKGSAPATGGADATPIPRADRDEFLTDLVGAAADRRGSVRSRRGAVVEAEDLVGALEGHGAVRHGEDGEAGGGEVVPQLQLGLDVDRARQVVEHDELRGVDEGPSRGQALALAAGQAQAARADQRALAVGHVRRRPRRWRRASGPGRTRRRAPGRGRRCRAPSRTRAAAPAAGTPRSAARGTRRGRAAASPFQHTSPTTSACHDSPSTARSSVLLPEPTGPVSTTKSPRRIANVMSCTPAPPG